MTELAGTAPEPTRGSGGLSLRRMLAATEIDLRLFGMLVALAAILIGFGIVTGGKILQPASIVTLSVQTTVVAIMATGMVLVIVSRNIDLSVGSTVGVVAMAYALLMTDWLPNILGIPLDSPLMWILALGLGLALGAGIGAFQGFIIAYIGVPSFIVTLGGLLALRGVVWLMSSGAAVSGLNDTFQRSAAAPSGRSAARRPGRWPSSAASPSSGCSSTTAGSVAGSASRSVRCGRRCCSATVGCVAVLGVAAYMNANYWPKTPGRELRRRAQHPDPARAGCRSPTGFPWPILLVIGVTIVMTFLATRRKFGRYVYAYGGNPEAAELAGINTRWIDHEDVHADGPAVRYRRGGRVGPAQRRDARRRPEQRALRHRRRGRRRDLVRRWHRDDPGSGPGRLRHAGARLRPGLRRRELADPEHRRRRRPGRGRGLRHVQPPAWRRSEQWRHDD